MTPSQHRELRRLTANMWSLLRYAAARDGEPKEIGGPWMRTANILHRRGFVTLHKRGNGWHSIELTPAGREAVTGVGDNGDTKVRVKMSPLSLLRVR
jgi:hypothetical protein